jgi:hypothetical protein
VIKSVVDGVMGMLLLEDWLEENTASLLSELEKIAVLANTSEMRSHSLSCLPEPLFSQTYLANSDHIFGRSKVISVESSALTLPIALNIAIVSAPCQKTKY